MISSHPQSFTIIDLTQETEDTRSYVLKPFQSEKFQYKAGEFLTCLFEIEGKQLRRPYSLASAPAIDKNVKILVKRIPNGIVSRYIHETWKIGALVYSTHPAGKFLLPEPSDIPYDIFLAAAGSGISPIIGLLKQALHALPKTHIKLFYSNRNAEQTIFYEELTLLQSQFPDRLYIEYLFSESKNLNKARLNRFLLEELVQAQLKYELKDAFFYTCGPYDYMQMCEIVARHLGFDKEKIKKEIYTVPEDEGDDDAESTKVFELNDKGLKTVQIKFRQDVYTLKVGFPDTILDVALRENIDLPYSCNAGQCSSCTAICIEGKVVMSYNAVLTEKDEKKGLILTCKSHPITDKVTLSFED